MKLLPSPSSSSRATCELLRSLPACDSIIMVSLCLQRLLFGWLAAGTTTKEFLLPCTIYLYVVAWEFNAMRSAMQFHSVYMWQEERCTEHKSTDGSWLSCNNNDKRVKSWSDYIVMEQSIISRNSVVLQQCKWQLSSSEKKKIDSNLSSQFEIFFLSAAVALPFNSKCGQHSRQP